MKMFSDCSGECCVCACGGLCLAGHGDDDYSPASAEQIIERLDNWKYPSYREYMMDYLDRVHGIKYENNTPRPKEKEEILDYQNILSKEDLYAKIIEKIKTNIKPGEIAFLDYYGKVHFISMQTMKEIEK